MLFIPTTILAWAALALAATRTTAPHGALTVGHGGKYTTIQHAVDALSASSSAAQSIFITPGTYNEQVHIKALKGPLTIYGSTSDTSSYHDNKVTITADKTSGGDDETATLRVWTSNFKMYNVNVKNTHGKGTPALALSASAANQGYYACAFTGYQDTLLAETGAQLYAHSYIEGAVDFIFGQRANAWFDTCDIRVSAPGGSITASGRGAADENSYYVINKCTVAAASDGHGVGAGTVTLGRPWRPYARVAFQETSLSEIVSAKGWLDSMSGKASSREMEFGEFGNSGPGSRGKRAGFVKELKQAVAIGDVLGRGYQSAGWVDKAYLS